MRCEVVGPQFLVWLQSLVVLVVNNALCAPFFFLAYVCRRNKPALLIIAASFLTLHLWMQWPRMARELGIHPLALFTSTQVVVAGCLHIVELAASNAPADATKSLGSWMWYLTAALQPEVTRDGKIMKAPPGALLKHIQALLKHIALCSLSVSLVVSFGTRPASFLLASYAPDIQRGNWLLSVVSLVVDRYVTAVAAWSVLAAIYSVGSLELVAQGIQPLEPFHDPIFSSSSVRDLWGRRWNMQWSEFLRRACYTPLRRSKISYPVASLCTFIVSSGAHEVQALLAMERYKLGSMTKFFLCQGALVYAEAVLERQAMQEPAGKAILEKIPFRLKNAIAFFLIAVCTGPLFIDTWEKIGFFDNISAMPLTVKCSVE